MGHLTVTPTSVPGSFKQIGVWQSRYSPCEPILDTLSYHNVRLSIYLKRPKTWPRELITHYLNLGKIYKYSTEKPSTVHEIWIQSYLSLELNGDNYRKFKRVQSIFLYTERYNVFTYVTGLHKKTIEMHLTKLEQHCCRGGIKMKCDNLSETFVNGFKSSRQIHTV